MRELELSISHLLPTQTVLHEQGVEDYRMALEKGHALDCIHALPYPFDESEEYIILDGHHKARAHFDNGLAVVRGIVYATDTNLAEYIRNKRAFWWPMQTKEDVRAIYREDWSARTRALGILSVGDIPFSES